MDPQVVLSTATTILNVNSLSLHEICLGFFAYAVQSPISLGPIAHSYIYILSVSKSPQWRVPASPLYPSKSGLRS